MDEIEIKKLLLDRNATPSKIARKLGITSQYASFILLGRRKGKKYQERIARILGVGKAELFGKENVDGN